MTEARRAFAASLLTVAVLALLYGIHPSFFARDDFQLQFLPGSREVARAWSEGSFPLLSPWSWVSSGLAAEYQYGVFSLFRTLLDILVWAISVSLTARAAILFIVHAAIASAGGFLLARSYRVSVAAATMVAVVTGLNGWMLWWGTTWYPVLAAFAWLPWYWLALRGIVEGRGRWNWLGAALSLDLLIAAGSPYPVAMAAAVAVMHLVIALSLKRWRAAAVLGFASIAGLCLAAPAVLMLLEYFPWTARLSAATSIDERWTVPPLALFGFAVPWFSTKWRVFQGLMPHPAVELLGGFVPVAAIVAGMSRKLLRERAPEIMLLACVLAAALLPSAGPFRWSFRWLPLVHMLLAIVGATAFDQRPSRAPLAGVILIATTAAISAAAGSETRVVLFRALVLALFCVAWALLTRKESVVAALMPATITVVAVVLTFVSLSRSSEVPTWTWDDSLLSPAPLDSSRRYLALYSFDDVTERDEEMRVSRGVHTELRPGNLAMLAPVEMVNGYSPMGLAAIHNLFRPDAHGPLMRERAERLLELETNPQQLLDHMGVHGLIVPEAMARRHAVRLAGDGWRPAARLGGCLVLHREGDGMPAFAAASAWRTSDEKSAYAAVLGRGTAVVVLGPGSAGLERFEPRSVVTDRGPARLQTTVHVGAGPRALVVFRRPWLPGWRAELDGKPLPVVRADMVMPAVEVAAGRGGTLRLYYRPASLITGGIIAALAVLLLIAVAVWQVRR